MNVTCSLVGTRPAIDHPVPGTVIRSIKVDIADIGATGVVHVVVNQNGAFPSKDDLSRFGLQPAERTAVHKFVREFAETLG